MGEIWLIENDELNVKFVVKNPFIDFSQNFNYKTSIPDEAKILITLDFHPNIITCIRIDIINKIPRYIMEYANFGSLRDLMYERSLNLKDILHIAIQICSGMFHAHNHPHSLIHRDLKPENILLSTIDINKGNDSESSLLIAKIADFGLVKQLLRTSTSSSDNSLPPYFAGTPGYASPEQHLYFEKTDKDSDIFSFGVILFEMITGYIPFIPTIEIFQNKREEINNHIETSLKRYNVSCPPELISIIKKCVQFDPSDRWKVEKESGKFQYFETIKKDLIKIYEKYFQTYEYPFDNIPLSSTLYQIRGRSLSNIREYNYAIKCYDKVLEQEPNNIDVLNNKGLDLFHLQKYEEAITCLDMVLALDSNYVNAYTNKGLALAGLKRYEDAKWYFDKAIELDPNHKYAYNNKGLILTIQENYPDAIDCYEEALKIDPNYIPALINKAITLKLNQDDSASKVLDKALKLDREETLYWIEMTTRTIRYKDQ